ncbi:MAG: hypothetical protein PWQ69_1074 [Methanomicrobiaceae archaeon]|nr:hypothetical protein [Methanomicrobiaceae archaeon]
MDPSAIREITILPGRSRSGSTRSSSTRATRYRSSAPPAPGKSAFINDIEVFARNDTATGRTVLVNGEYPPEEFVRDPAHKPVALITQNTRCLADLTVEEFLAMHVRSRKIDDESIVGRTIALANEFTGEEIRSGARMTALSGGQTRSLLVADAVMVAAAPVLDLQGAGDRGAPCPGERRSSSSRTTPWSLSSPPGGSSCGMGAVERVIEPDGREDAALREGLRLDETLRKMREEIRAGNLITEPVGA